MSDDLMNRDKALRATGFLQARLDNAEARVRELEAALRDADAYLADPAGHPIDAINFARGVIRAAAGGAEGDTDA